MNQFNVRVFLILGCFQSCRTLLFHNNNPIPSATAGPLSKDATISLLAQEILELKASMRTQQLKSEECESRIKRLESGTGNETSIIAHEISENMEKLKETVLNQQNNTSEFQTAFKKLKELEQLVKSQSNEMQVIQGKLQQISTQPPASNPSVSASINELQANLSFVETSLLNIQSIMTSVAENSTFVDTIFVPHRLRLMGGDWNAGRIEYQKDGSWGTICSYGGFGKNTAKVICRLLGRPWQNPLLYYHSEFGIGRGSTVLSHVNCTGNEILLIECPHYDGGDLLHCSATTQAGVRCQ